MKTTRKSVLEPKDRTYLLKNGMNPLTLQENVYFILMKRQTQINLFVMLEMQTHHFKMSKEKM
jgi:hypothetical protein